MAAVIRRQYKGAAASTSITATLSIAGTSTTISATTGWPSTASVPFIVVIDPGTSSEEKCSATISGSTLTLTRAVDDTTAVEHSSGAAIYPVFSADEADEANLFTSTMTTRGDLLTMGLGPTVSRLPLGALSYVLTSNGNDPTWGQIVEGGIATNAVTNSKIIDDAVTSAKILDDTIMNIDINSAAQISQSKIATLVTDLAAKAPLASPTFTGTVTAPTFSGALTGTATNATSAATATNVAYTGLTGTIPTWNQNTTGSSASCSGNSATATNLVGMARGNQYIPTSGSLGVITIAHGLGAIPSVVFAQSADGTAYGGAVTLYSGSHTTSDIVLSISVPNIPCRIYWMAFA